MNDLRQMLLGTVGDFRNRVNASKSENELLEISKQILEHPDGYDGPCSCQSCMDYAK